MGGEGQVIGFGVNRHDCRTGRGMISHDRRVSMAGGKALEESVTLGIG